MMDRRLVFDEDSVYEIDEICMKRKREMRDDPDEIHREKPVAGEKIAGIRGERSRTDN